LYALLCGVLLHYTRTDYHFFSGTLASYEAAVERIEAQKKRLKERNKDKVNYIIILTKHVINYTHPQDSDKGKKPHKSQENRSQKEHKSQHKQQRPQQHQQESQQTENKKRKRPTNTHVFFEVVHIMMLLVEFLLYNT